MGKPFKAAGTPKKAPGSENETPAPAIGKAVVNTQRTGDPLPNASKDVPPHSPSIAWPLADNGKKPFKNTR